MARITHEQLMAVLARKRCATQKIRVVKTEGCSAPALKKCDTKAERKVMAWLDGEGYRIIPQPTNLFPMHGGNRYTPDFLAWRDSESGILVVEVKQEGAHYRGYEQGYERYKRCANDFDGRQWRFAMATVMKDGTIRVDVWSQMPEKISQNEEN